MTRKNAKDSDTNLKLARFAPALLRLDPMFDPLRNDPRFQKLAGLPAPNDAKQ